MAATAGTLHFVTTADAVLFWALVLGAICALFVAVWLLRRPRSWVRLLIALALIGLVVFLVVFLVGNLTMDTTTIL